MNRWPALLPPLCWHLQAGCGRLTAPRAGCKVLAGASWLQRTRQTHCPWSLRFAKCVLRRSIRPFPPLLLGWSRVFGRHLPYSCLGANTHFDWIFLRMFCFSTKLPYLCITLVCVKNFSWEREKATFHHSCVLRDVQQWPCRPNFTWLKNPLNRSQQDLCHSQSLYPKEQLPWKGTQEKKNHPHDSPGQVDFYKRTK